ncbi:MAG: DinI-like family protein [Pantoea sp.]|uniref:DinI-like family protein n=1 Tax=Pantoea sp. TaxID=69393 RepID=UPI00239C9484|nr:DinI-like family protein [Pantoea sp.]MDE1188179.1 DinI-like family protein [Pantoea sp.]
MIVEVMIAKEKAKGMPKGAMDALREELTKRLSHNFDDLSVVVKTASNDGLSLLRSKDKEGDKAIVSQVLQDAWESADDWFNG